MKDSEQIGLRIRTARKAAGLTQDELSRVLRVSRPAVAQWESGRTVPSTKKIAEIARALGLPEIDLFHAEVPDGGRMAKARSIKFVPELSWDQAVLVRESSDVRDTQGAREWPCPVECSDGAFAYRVEGDAMLPSITPGTMLIVDPTVKAKQGKHVLAVIDGHVVVREYQEEGCVPMLKAKNPSWPVPYLYISDEDRVIGTVLFALMEF